MTHYQFSQIFLGFAAKDRYTVAESLLYHLENYGVPVWYDRHDLIIGDNRQKENFEKGIIESKYAIIIFSENTEDCFCLNEEIDVIYNMHKKEEIRVFPILFNITFEDLPQKYKWIKELIYREIRYPPNNPPFPKTKDPRVRNSGIYFTVICRSSV